MKRLFLSTLLLLLSFSAFAQEQDPCYSINDFISQLDIKPPISYQLSVGWNMVAYTGTAENSGIENQINNALSNNSTVESTFQIIKNVSGQFWSSAFAQMNNFTQGEGYLMYVISELPPSLSFYSAINIPEIIGCTDCTAENYNVWATSNDESCLILGCTDPSYIEYNASANIDDSSCLILTPPILVGDLLQGGIVFYVDQTGDHGLVAALEDITEGSNMGVWGTDEGFEWGCYGSSVIGADGTAIGTGYQNTLDIVAQNCKSNYGGITAAQATLNYVSEGYTDWFLPSKEEFIEMHNTIGESSLHGNIAGFETSDTPCYWSSSEYNVTNAWYVYFNNGIFFSNKINSLRVRAIRAF